MKGKRTMRKLISITALAAVAVLAFAVPASVADRTPGRGDSGSPGSPALPPGVDVSRWPTYLKGSVTGFSHDFSYGTSTTVNWRSPDLKLKRERVKVMPTSVQVVYKVASGILTWSYQNSGSAACSFTDSFSLKGEKWTMDDRITFFAPKKGRYKNRWRMDGMIDSMHEGPCEIPLGSFAWREVGQTPPIAWPGKTVRLSHDYHRVLDGGFNDEKGTLSIRIPR
jgi:hypothetical protein